MVLMTEVMKEAVKDGMKYAETGPMLEDNIKVQPCENDLIRYSIEEEDAG